ncbi:hypothetical protein [Bosea sp. (in: a-proteobacteria)]|uniref:hypothetical protein n=1 Tax=Bosea sp. (in: a-proteobacteria) TaxID=1871050 RepID=UPI00263568AF|nr:hypothetical protein [Bosea sp. (in: a-proteobacteria)]MCO5089497.1 hypothetical protein [Bosea sp. (in: a-proteobacteria)]
MGELPARPYQPAECHHEDDRLAGPELDPSGETAPRPFDAAQWRLLSADAFAFYRTLPAGKLGWRDILGFGLRDSAWDFAFLGFCGVIGAGLALLPPIASAQIANIAVHTADTGFLIDLLMVLVVALVAETTFHVVGHLAELRAQGRSGLALHAAMVDRLLRLTPAALRGSTTLILATQMETVEKFRRAMIGFAAAGALALVNGLAAALLVAFISPMAGLAAIGLVVLLLAVACLLGWAQFRAIYEGERMDVVVLAFVYDLIRLIPVIRAGHREKRAFTQWSENFLAFQSRIMRSTRLSNRLAVIEPLWEALTLALCFAALAYAGSRILQPVAAAGARDQQERAGRLVEDQEGAVALGRLAGLRPDPAQAQPMGRGEAIEKLIACLAGLLSDRNGLGLPQGGELRRRAGEGARRGGGPAPETLRQQQAEAVERARIGFVVALGGSALGSGGPFLVGEMPGDGFEQILRRLREGFRSFGFGRFAGAIGQCAGQGLQPGACPLGSAAGHQGGGPARPDEQRRCRWRAGQQRLRRQRRDETPAGAAGRDHEEIGRPAAQCRGGGIGQGMALAGCEPHACDRRGEGDVHATSGAPMAASPCVAAS